MSASDPKLRATELVVPALGVAPGRTCGPLRRNEPTLDAAAVEGAILLAERVLPADLERILAAAGTLTLGGALLSHVNLLSRELGKPSVALLAETRASLLPAGSAEVLELGNLTGGADRPVRLSEGDVVLLDGDRGVVRVPGGADPAARARVRRLHDLLESYARRPSDGERLEKLVAAATPLGPSRLGMMLEAALLCRGVPEGRPAQGLVQAMLASACGDSVRSILERVAQEVVIQLEDRCRRTLLGLDEVESPNELSLRRELLRSVAARDRSVLVDIGAPTRPLERAYERAKGSIRDRMEILRGRIDTELRTVLEQHDSDRRAAASSLVRRARQADVDPELVRRFENRVSAPLERKRKGVDSVLVVAMEDAEAAERTLVGGKAAGLSRARPNLPQGCRIPAGFVLTSSAYRSILRGETGETIRRAVESGQDEATVSELARNAILTVPIPREIESAVEERLVGLAGSRLAVRSSATVEDGPESSLAGMFDTFLGVSGREELLDRIRWTWASLWNERALRLLASSGRFPLSASLAVLVQEMIPVRTAGVMITRDPAGRSDTVVINAAWGLGEAISMGQVSGDLFWVRRSTGEVSAVKPGRSGKQIVLDPERRGTRAVELPGTLRDKICLDEKELKRLAALAVRLEGVESWPMDVEFGFDEEGGLILFQARRVAPESAEACQR